MKTLNLAIPKATQIKYRVDSFPDGQHQVAIIDSSWFEDGDEGVQIQSRFSNFYWLELIICAVKSLRGMGVKKIHLYTPYFLGERSDIKFEIGGNNYLKDVVCPIINSLGLESITVLDPHSTVLEACLNNFEKKSNQDLFAHFLTVQGAKDDRRPSEVLEETFIVSPDAGALKKIYSLADSVKYKRGIIKGDKHRTSDGSIISGASYPKNFLDEDYRKDLVIVDDICDGGKTFVELAKVLRENGHRGKFYLVISHGIFSAGFKELEKHFHGIYCTNSYAESYPEAPVKKFSTFNVFC